MASLRRKLSKTLSFGKIREEQKPRIGMFCGRWDDSATARDVVRQASHHVLSNKKTDDGSATRETYADAVNKVVNEAKAIYHDSPEDGLGTEDFVKTMIDHGCFILQVALCSLGGSKPLGYPTNDRIFGELWNKEKIRIWVTSIFCIRKQLPLVVLQELMKQSFFQKVLASRKNWKRPKDLPRMVLYDFLVAPALYGTSAGGYGKIVKRVFSFINGRGMGNLQQQHPPTLLHALWLQLTGPGSTIGQNRCIKSDDVDDDDGDEYSGWFTVRSATELEKAGIIFRNNDGLGIRGIQLKKRMLNAILCLPSISIEPNSTKSLFENLILYEEEMNLDGNMKEVCGYLKFMKELIRTPHDVKLLATQGIIHADPKQENELPGMLEKLHLPEVGNNHNYHLGVVRHQIRVYVRPNGWKMLTHLLQVTLALTLLQTIYTILGYYQSKNDKKKA